MLGFSDRENQMEKKLENRMETRLSYRVHTAVFQV